MALGEVVLHRAGRGSSSGLPDADPITTEVIRHGLDSAADQMRLALRRSAFSPIIYEISDFSAALYDAEVRLLAQAQSLPMFLGTLSFCIQTAVEKAGGVARLEPGDVIFSTYGYDIGSHQQDATIVVPAFVDGELVGYAAVKAHHMDIGAKEIYCTDTTDIFQEGAIFPSVKLYRRGELDRDMYRTILANSRLPTALAGDLQAQIGAAALRSNAFSNSAVRLAPGQTAHAWLKVAVAANFPAATCQPVTAHWLRVYPPGETAAGYVSHTFSACSSASAVLLTVLPVRAGQGVAGVTP